MTTFKERVAYTGRRIGTAQLDLSRSPSSAHTDDSSTRRTALLTSIVKAEILPRLARSRHNVAAVPTAPVTTAEDTRQLVDLLLTLDVPHAVAFLDTLQQRGVTPSALYLGIITQAAQALGDLWDQDLCDFAQVTISMGRLQQVLRALSSTFQIGAVRRSEAESILLLPAPGDQHTLGLIMLAEFFQREGWHVAGGPSTQTREAAAMVRGTWIDVVGFSVGSWSRVDDLAQCIRLVRRASHNPNVYIMVGGPLLLSRPDLVTRVGADAAAGSAAGAVRQAHDLLATRMAAD